MNGKLGKKALVAGKDTDGSLIYAGRAMYAGINLPAKIIPKKNSCYVSYNGVEIAVEDFEVVAAKCDKFTWEPSCHGKIEANVVVTGRDGCDELFIGRAPFEGSLTVGKVHPSHQCLYIPFNGTEQRLTHYEVLIYKPKKDKKDKKDKKYKKGKNDKC